MKLDSKQKKSFKHKLFILLGMLVAGFVMVIACYRWVPPIRIVSSDLDPSTLYALIYSNTGPDFVVKRVNPSGLIEADAVILKRGSHWAMCITDGEVVYWDGRVELGLLGCSKVEVSRDSSKNTSLSRMMSGLLHESDAWKKQNAGDVVVPSVEGDAIMAKLNAIIIPVVHFENTTVEEAVDFLRARCTELDPDIDPARKGVSFIVRQPRPKGEGDRNSESISLDRSVNYSARNKPILDVLAEVGRQGQMDVYLTSVGIIITPEGVPPFPNPKAAEGEVLKVVRKSK